MKVSTEESLAIQILQVFQGVAKPPKDQIALHQCEECEELREAFAPYDFRDIPDCIVRVHSESLSLMSPQALHHYLPAYMRYALKKPDSHAFEFVLYQLDPGENESIIQDYKQSRLRVFSGDQRKIICEYLAWAGSRPESKYLQDYIRRALPRWGVEE